MTGHKTSGYSAITVSPGYKTSGYSAITVSAGGVFQTARSAPGGAEEAADQAGGEPPGTERQETGQAVVSQRPLRGTLRGWG